MKSFALLAFAIALTALSAGAAEPGNLMRITSSVHMRMAGMPAMPPMTHTRKTCVAVKKPDPRASMPHGSQCKISHYQHVGNTISYHLSCSGQMPMSGDGKITELAGGGVHGTAHMTSGSSDQPMQMDMSWDGTRLGSCTYNPPAAR